MSPKFGFQMLAAVAVSAAIVMPAPSRAAEILQTQTFSAGLTLVVGNEIFDGDVYSQPGADSVTYRGGGAGSTSLAFAPFDAALGTLTGIQITLLSSQQMTAGVSIAVNRDQGFGRADVGMIFDDSLYLAGSELASSDDEIGSRGSYPFCTANAATMFCLGARTQDSTFDATLASSNLALFSGFDDVVFSLPYSVRHTVGAISGTPRPTFASMADFKWSGSLSLRYLYDAAPPLSAVPEPAAWGLMVVGFGAVGGLIRGRRRAGVRAA